jgi:hypothetical protein
MSESTKIKKSINRQKYRKPSQSLLMEIESLTGSDVSLSPISIKESLTDLSHSTSDAFSRVAQDYMSLNILSRKKNKNIFAQSV